APRGPPVPAPPPRVARAGPAAHLAGRAAGAHGGLAGEVFQGELTAALLLPSPPRGEGRASPGAHFMTSTKVCDDLPVVAHMSPDQRAAKLRELGEGDAAGAPGQDILGMPSYSIGDFLPWTEKLWSHTAHAFGYLAPAAPGATLLPIRHAGNI